LTENKQEKSIPQLIVRLFDLLIRLVEENLQFIVQKRFLSPIKKALQLAVLTAVAATLLFLAVIFISVGLIILLEKLVGSWWLTFLILAAFLVAVSLILIWLMRRIGNSG
jgi:hypothetical protein